MKKLRRENIPENICEQWQKFYQDIYDSPISNYSLILIRRHKSGQPDLIDGINGSSIHAGRLALEALHNKKFSRNLGYDLIQNALIGDWIDYPCVSGDCSGIL